MPLSKRGEQASSIPTAPFPSFQNRQKTRRCLALPGFLTLDRPGTVALSPVSRVSKAKIGEKCENCEDRKARPIGERPSKFEKGVRCHFHPNSAGASELVGSYLAIAPAHSCSYRCIGIVLLCTSSWRQKYLFLHSTHTLPF